MIIMTRKEYESKPPEYRGTLDGKPALLYLDPQTGGTVWGPIQIIEIRPLTCCCCTGETRGRQWYNRDTGYGLCDKCADWIERNENLLTMHQNYGIPGIHYRVGAER